MPEVVGSILVPRKTNVVAFTCQSQHNPSKLNEFKDSLGYMKLCPKNTKKKKKFYI